MILVIMVIWRKRTEIFHIDSLTSFWCYECEKSGFGWLLIYSLLENQKRGIF